MKIIKNFIKNIYKKYIFKKNNKDSNVYLNKLYGLVDPKKIQVGKYSYGPLNVYTFSNNDGKIIIGDFCSIGDEVTFLTGGGHYYESFLTFPVQRKIFGGEFEATSKGDIIIEDDVWIGYGATILSGVTLHRGCIVGAKAVITKDVPAYAIVVGSPAKIIKYRFDEETKQSLISLNFTKLDVDKLKKIYMDKNVSNKNIQRIQNIIEDENI